MYCQHCALDYSNIKKAVHVLNGHSMGIKYADAKLVSEAKKQLKASLAYYKKLPVKVVLSIIAALAAVGCSPAEIPGYANIQKQIPEVAQVMSVDNLDTSDMKEHNPTTLKQKKITLRVGEQKTVKLDDPDYTFDNKSTTWIFTVKAMGDKAIITGVGPGEADLIASHDSDSTKMKFFHIEVVK